MCCQMAKKLMKLIHDILNMISICPRNILFLTVKKLALMIQDIPIVMSESQRNTSYLMEGGLE